MGVFSFFGNFFRELSDAFSLFSSKNAALRRIVFYSESDIYYQYYEDVIAKILETSDFEVCYVTSDPRDSVFDKKIPRLRPFYLRAVLPFAFIYFDSAAFVMTMPDLGNFHIKRSMNEVEYFYAFHAVGSTHLQYRKGAFDHYDAILCAGPYQVRELRAAEKLYGAKEKKLVECGYPRLEKIYRDHLKFEAERAGGVSGETANILVAPTWSPGNIMDSCIGEIIGALRNNDKYRVSIRPHPEYIKRFPHRVKEVADSVRGLPGFAVELDMLSDRSLHEADVLITDWSGIFFEYALGTARPVLFIDTPMRVDNKAYKELGCEPVELEARKNLGISVPVSECGEIGEAVAKLVGERDAFRSRIEEYRQTLVYNFGTSAEIAARSIVESASRASGRA